MLFVFRKFCYSSFSLVSGVDMLHLRSSIQQSKQLLLCCGRPLAQLSGISLYLKLAQQELATILFFEKHIIISKGIWSIAWKVGLFK